MQFKDYTEQRNTLVGEAQTFLDNGNIGDEYQAAKKAIESLDTQYDEINKELANLESMKDNRSISNIIDAGVRQEGLNIMEILGNVDDKIDIYDSEEYRMAFMNRVLKGTEIPSKFKNAYEVTKTTDVGEMIPTTVMQRIIEKMSSTGMIWERVTKTAFKGGVKIPMSSVKPVATWVGEGEGSPKQKKGIDDYVIFTYHKLRCAVAVTLEVDTMSLPIFEARLVENIAEAMVKAIEQAIISGVGTEGPKGITKETPVVGQAISINEVDGFKYKELCKAEAALPQEYEQDAVWLMSKQTFMQWYAMTDDSGQPIGRINYGINGKPERTLLGREVVVNPYMASYNGTVTEDTLCAMLYNLKDYTVNTNLDMSIKKYEDNDNDDMVTKSVMLLDGKATDINSLVTVTVKNL